MIGYLTREHGGELGELGFGGLAHVLEFLSEDCVIHVKTQVSLSWFINLLRLGIVMMMVMRCIMIILMMMIFLQSIHELLVTSQLSHELFILQHHRELLVLYQLLITI